MTGSSIRAARIAIALLLLAGTAHAATDTELVVFSGIDMPLSPSDFRNEYEQGWPVGLQFRHPFGDKNTMFFAKLLTSAISGERPALSFGPFAPGMPPPVVQSSSSGGDMRRTRIGVGAGYVGTVNGMQAHIRALIGLHHLSFEKYTWRLEYSDAACPELGCGTVEGEYGFDDRNDLGLSLGGGLDVPLSDSGSVAAYLGASLDFVFAGETGVPAVPDTGSAVRVSFPGAPNDDFSVSTIQMGLRLRF